MNTKTNNQKVKVSLSKVKVNSLEHNEERKFLIEKSIGIKNPDNPSDTFSSIIKQLKEEIFEYKAYNEGDSYNWEKVLKKANDFFRNTNNTESYHKLLEQKLETAKQLKEIHEDEICKLLAEWRIEVKQMEKDYIKKELVEKAINDWFKEVNGVVVLKYHKPTGKDYIWNIEEWKRLKEELRKSIIGGNNGEKKN